MVTGTDIRKLAADAQLEPSKARRRHAGKRYEKIMEYSFETKRD